MSTDHQRGRDGTEEHQRGGDETKWKRVIRCKKFGHPAQPNGVTKQIDSCPDHEDESIHPLQPNDPKFFKGASEKRRCTGTMPVDPMDSPVAVFTTLVMKKKHTR